MAKRLTEEERENLKKISSKLRCNERLNGLLNNDGEKMSIRIGGLIKYFDCEEIEKALDLNLKSEEIGTLLDNFNQIEID